jgi:hypothetical protein
MVEAQSPVAHVTSQAHAALQSTVPHELAPVHITVQAPCRLLPHMMSPHAELAEHAIVHTAAAVQSMSPHEPSCAHVMLHAMFAGHMNAAPPVGVTMHCGGFCVRSQPPLHTAGQPPELSSTQ